MSHLMSSQTKCIRKILEGKISCKGSCKSATSAECDRADRAGSTGSVGVYSVYVISIRGKQLGEVPRGAHLCGG